MKTLIIKLGATGDVLRTTTLLNILSGEIDWITGDENLTILNNNPEIVNCVPWSRAYTLKGSCYDLVINLEDSLEVARFLSQIKYKELFGAYIGEFEKLTYTENSKEWFDLSLISNFGKDKADEFKLNNRRSYQEMIFNSLGYPFQGEKYFLPQPVETDLVGDIAIGGTAGPVWPMKKWAYYNELKLKLEEVGHKVNILPTRPTVLQHIADVQNHKCLISGDSLPMHIALGSGIPCVTIFQCTSPWEIYDYSIQTKIISPLLERYFYKRHFDVEATTCIPIKEVFKESVKIINSQANGRVSEKGSHSYVGRFTKTSSTRVNQDNRIIVG